MLDHAMSALPLVPDDVGHFQIVKLVMEYMLPPNTRLHKIWSDMQAKDASLRRGAKVVLAGGGTRRKPWADRKGSIVAAVMHWFHNQLMPADKERKAAKRQLMAEAASLRWGPEPTHILERLKTIRSTLESIGHHHNLPYNKMGEYLYNALLPAVQAKYNDRRTTDATRKPKERNSPHLLDLENLPPKATLQQIERMLSDLDNWHHEAKSPPKPRSESPGPAYNTRSRFQSRNVDRLTQVEVDPEDSESSTEAPELQSDGGWESDDGVRVAQAVGDTGPAFRAAGQRRFGDRNRRARELPRQGAPGARLQRSGQPSFFVAQVAAAREGKQVAGRQPGPCWQCGQMGHLQRNCPNPPDLNNPTAKALMSVQHVDDVTANEQLCLAVMGTDMETAQVHEDIPEGVCAIMAELHAKADAMCNGLDVFGR